MASLTQGDREHDDHAEGLPRGLLVSDPPAPATLTVGLPVTPRYSGDARTLDRELGDWLRTVPVQVVRSITHFALQNITFSCLSNLFPPSFPSPQSVPARAVICPHAGYRYSGPTAAHSFRQIDPR